MHSKSKTFAFKVAEKKDGNNRSKQWSIRDGIAAAGCTDYRLPGDLRYENSRGGKDLGAWC